MATTVIGDMILGASAGQLALPLERAFAAACAAIFDAPFLSHGFSRGTARLEPTFCTQDYCAGTRYIAVSVTADPREPPFYSNIRLGDGSVDWPDRDWNSVALWRLARKRGVGDEVSPGNYPLSDSAEGQLIPSDLGPLFTRMRDDLISFAADFLTDDLRAFRRVRAAQTRARSPYMIHCPDGQGGYVSSVDPASAKLKERFSLGDAE
jgi:hypothetical protein